MPRQVAVLLAVLLTVGATAVLPGVAGASHLSNAGPVEGPGTISAPSGPTITVTGSAQVNLSGGFSNANQLELLTSKGNATFTSSGDAAATINFSEFDGAAVVNVTGLSVATNALTINVENAPGITVSGDADSLNFSTSMALDDGQMDFVYAGASGTTTVTARGLPANTELAAVDNDTHTVLAVAMTDGSGTVTFSGMTNSEHRVELMTTDGGPTLNDSSASPTGGLSVSSQTLSIEVTDPDFPNDNVTVEFFKDGNSIGTTTLTSNGTATMPTTFSLGGSHTWHAVATDEYGTTDTSSTFTVQTPNELRILNESAPTTLVDNATVELRFYVDEGSGAPQVYTRNTSDGTVNMTGLPVDKPFVVVAEADGYFSRRIFVPSLFETQKVFLLPENETAVQVTFAIEDYTGEFPPATTVLQVQRALNGSYKTVLGDFFGATGEFPATVAFNQRHRLVLLNSETGETRSLGAFTPQSTSNQRVVVSPTGSIDVLGIPPTITFPATTRLPAQAGVPFNASIQNGSQDIQSWNLTLTANTTTVFTTSGSGSASIDTTLDLSAVNSPELTATMTYTLANGSTNSVSESYTLQAVVPSADDTLLGSLAALVALVPGGNQSAFTTFLAMVTTVIGTAVAVRQVPMSSEFIGVVAWLILAVFGVIGWVSYDLLFVAGVAAASLAYLRRVGG